jgi:hypothetical protein
LNSRSKKKISIGCDSRAEHGRWLESNIRWRRGRIWLARKCS